MMALLADGLDPTTLRVAGIVLGLVYGLATICVFSDLLPRRDMARGTKIAWSIVVLVVGFLGHAAYYVWVYRKRR